MKRAVMQIMRISIDGLGGNGISDNSVAEESGDVYFYSPQKLDGNRGSEKAQNLYVYRDGVDQYVTTFTPGTYCSMAPRHAVRVRS